MNPISTELWRKPETVPLSKFDKTFYDSIRKGIQVIEGSIADDSKDYFEINEEKQEPPTVFSEDDMNILREYLGPQLIHGGHTLPELKQILATQKETEGKPFKKR